MRQTSDVWKTNQTKGDEICIALSATRMFRPPHLGSTRLVSFFLSCCFCSACLSAGFRLLLIPARSTPAPLAADRWIDPATDFHNRGNLRLCDLEPLLSDRRQGSLFCFQGGHRIALPDFRRVAFVLRSFARRLEDVFALQSVHAGFLSADAGLLFLGRVLSPSQKEGSATRLDGIRLASCSCARLGSQVSPRTSLLVRALPLEDGTAVAVSA